MREWDPDQYLQFRQERTRPSIDLAARIPMDDPRTIIDIGCGPGNSTQVLLRRWPHAEIVGVDKSEKMIERARRDYPQQKWVVGDASTFEPGSSFDIVFSNAAIQWIPQHDILLERLFRMLNENGVLAVQVPQNQESPLFRAILRVSESGTWSRYTKGREAAITYHSASYYYNQLASYTKDIALWETVYYHVMNSPEDLIEWYKGTAMRPFLDSLPTDESRQEFTSEILTDCRAAYPPQGDGKILYPFKRLFFLARKPFNA
jgi:trans-aconitate 2-methyltransferase